MDEPAPKYNREFLKSVHHAWLGLLTLGTGFISGEPLYLLLGGTAYILGWIYLPGMPFFKRWVDQRHQAVQQRQALAEVEQFNQRRQSLLSALSRSRRERYDQLAAVCQEIENASADHPLTPDRPGADPRLRKLDELMWTYLRMLTIEESLERFLETERREDVPRLAQEADRDAAALRSEIEALRKDGRHPLLETKQRLLNSLLDRSDVLSKRLHRIEQAQANLALVVSEQERLDQQIKLIRADAIAARNTQALTTRIDATVEHLDQTNKWLAEMDEFKDLVGDLPAGEIRVGFRPAPPPPIIQSQPARAPVAAKAKAKP